ncbi:hypothetical protein ROZALSC1DRAFT_16666, partial [Rozella allomycis CSF55]
MNISPELQDYLKTQNPEGTDLPAPRLSSQQLEQVAGVLDQRYSGKGNIKVADPDFFTGDSKKLPSFIRQINFVFEAQKEKFTSDRLKVIFAASYLRGSAAKWL